MSYYKVCPYCGVNLDPGEVCDCREKEKALASAANADEGKAEQNFTPDSASNDNRNGGLSQ